ncbi:hypothetical protein [Vibrio barjaei]|uniref:hypothetical protein n=1 Tax=Vibrio barjaei TaxID=1676683 RepID=UPI002284EFB9|nr:hypothetical protein [Vibrio barjaei]MCY9873007.1 hypothetical protein [Vibrio barjaei]
MPSEHSNNTLKESLDDTWQTLAHCLLTIKLNNSTLPYRHQDLFDDELMAQNILDCLNDADLVHMKNPSINIKNDIIRLKQAISVDPHLSLTRSSPLLTQIMSATHAAIIIEAIPLMTGYHAYYDTFLRPLSQITIANNIDEFAMPLAQLPYTAFARALSELTYPSIKT